MPLRKLRPSRQVPGEPPRRWFFADEMDLTVWSDPDGAPSGFQLCYNKERGERALTWWLHSGLTHSAVDDGETDPVDPRRAPVLVSFAEWDADGVREQFLLLAGEVPPDVVALVSAVLGDPPPAGEWPMALDRSTAHRLDADRSSSDWEARAAEEPAAEAVLLQPAATWRRALARVIDRPVFLLTSLMTASAILSRVANEQFSPLLVLGVMVIGFPGVVPLEVLCLRLFGNTLGKAIAGIVIVTVTGEAPATETLWRRTLSMWIRGMGCGLPVIGLICGVIVLYDISFDAAPWDYRNGTRVVRRVRRRAPQRG